MTIKRFLWKKTEREREREKERKKERKRERKTNNTNFRGTSKEICRQKIKKSSGQCVCLPLQRSEFKSHRSLPFLFCKFIVRDKYKQKVVWMVHFLLSKNIRQLERIKQVFGFFRFFKHIFIKN